MSELVDSAETKSTIIICKKPDRGALPEINFWNRGSLQVHGCFPS